MFVYLIRDYDPETNKAGGVLAIVQTDDIRGFLDKSTAITYDGCQNVTTNVNRLVDPSLITVYVKGERNGAAFEEYLHVKKFDVIAQPDHL